MILVTGATSGIGRATALGIAARGIAVGAVGRRQELLDELSRQAPNIISTSADLSTSNGIDQTIALAADHQIAGVVHAAGTAIAPADYSELNGVEVAKAMAVHVTAPIELNNRLLAEATNQPPTANRLRITYIDSFSATEHRAGWSCYSIVKAAAQMAARAAQAELPTAQIIRIFPGGVNTPLVAAVLNGEADSPTRSAFRTIAADGKLVEPEEAAKFIVGLIVDATDHQLSSRETWNFNKPEDHIL